MKRINFIIKAALFIIFLSANLSFSQFIIETTSYSIPVDVYSIEELQEMENDEMSKTILDMPIKKLQQYANPDETEIEKSTIYIDGNSYAVETDKGEDGKMKVVMNNSENKFYVINYDQKMVMVISKDEIEQMQKNLGNMAKSKPNSSESKNSIDVKETGRTKNINGFNSEEYIKKDDNMSELTVIWASDDVKGLAGKVKGLLNQLKSFAPAEEEDDDSDKSEWELIEGKIPVEVRTINSDDVASGVIEIESIDKIEQRSVPKEKFSVPSEAEGFKHNSMNEVMQQMIQKMKEQYNQE